MRGKYKAAELERKKNFRKGRHICPCFQNQLEDKQKAGQAAEEISGEK